MGTYMDNYDTKHKKHDNHYFHNNLVKKNTVFVDIVVLIFPIFVANQNEIAENLY